MSKILVTGGTGMVGNAIQKVAPEQHDFVFLGSKDFDLRNETETRNMLAKYKPDIIIHLAAKVGGIKANTNFVADFFDENTLINTNLIRQAHQNDVQNLVSLLSTCVYPDAIHISYPLDEKQLHFGPPHSSNFGYAYAKRMLEVQSRAYRQQHKRNYICAIPNNIYGINDNFDLENGHVIPSLVRKIYEAKLNKQKPVLWGNGQPLREFTFAEDIAVCLLKLAGLFDDYKPDERHVLVNIGNTNEISIMDVAKIICELLDYDCNDIVWDTTKPTGQFRKPSVANKIAHEYIDLKTGLKKTCDWFISKYPNVRGVNEQI